MVGNRIAPLSELFLLLPENRRIILGESSKICLHGESDGLRKAAMWLSVTVVINVLVVFLYQAYISLQSNPPLRSPIVILMSLIPAILMLVFLYFVAQRFRCKAKLEQDGFLLPGEVVKAKWDRAVSQEGAKNVIRLQYLFMTPDNRQIIKEEAQVRMDLNVDQLPEPGRPLAIIYVDDSCFRVL